MKFLEVLGIFLLAAGLSSLIIYGLYGMFTAIFGLENVPLVIKLAVPAITVGLVLIAGVVIANRISSRKSEKFTEVDY